MTEALQKKVDFAINVEQEIWKDIEGYEGRYQVSNKGRVKSLYKTTQSVFNGVICTREYPERILTPIDTKSDTSKGYVRVHIGSGHGKRVLKLIHRLVATAFIPNPLNLPQVNHINGNKADNRADNLEWCSAKHNTQHALRNGLKKVFGHAEGHPVIATNIKTGEELYFESVAAAGRFLGQSCDHGLKRRKDKDKDKAYIINGYQLNLVNKLQAEA